MHRHGAAAAVAAVEGGLEGTATTHTPEWHSPTPSRRVLAAQLSLAAHHTCGPPWACSAQHGGSPGRCASHRMQ